MPIVPFDHLDAGIADLGHSKQWQTVGHKVRDGAVTKRVRGSSNWKFREIRRFGNGIFPAVSVPRLSIKSPEEGIGRISTLDLGDEEIRRVPRKEYPSWLPALVLPYAEFRRALVEVGHVQLSDCARPERQNAQGAHKWLGFSIHLLEERLPLTAVQVQSALAVGIPDRLQCFLPGCLRSWRTRRKHLVERGSQSNHVAVDR